MLCITEKLIQKISKRIYLPKYLTNSIYRKFLLADIVKSDGQFLLVL